MPTTMTGTAAPTSGAAALPWGTAADGTIRNLEISGLVTVENILEYGATTGATDNATAIQAAINAAYTAGGGAVFIPRGTWTTGPLQLKSNVTLKGEGWGSVLKLKNGSNANFITLYDIQTDHAGLVDIKLDANGGNQTAGNAVHWDNTGFNNSLGDGDPNHLMSRVFIQGAYGHGFYTAGSFSQSRLTQVFIYLSGLNNFRIESPDIYLDNCVSAKSGLAGFYVASNSNRLINCKSWLAGAVTATSGFGYQVAWVDRIDLIGCEAQDNRCHGYNIIGTTQLMMSGCRANRNGIGAAGTGGVGDGIYADFVTNSRVELVAYDHNNGGLMQRWGYNLGTNNDGNIVTMAIGHHQDDSVPGVGSWGPSSIIDITWLGKPLAAPVQPVSSSTQTGTTYTLTLADMGTVVEASNASAITVTIPPNSSVAYPIGTSIDIRQMGAGQVTIAPGAGVTIRSRGTRLKVAGQYGVASLQKRGTDEWVLTGDVTV